MSEAGDKTDVWGRRDEKERQENRAVSQISYQTQRSLYPSGTPVDFCALPAAFLSPPGFIMSILRENSGEDCKKKIILGSWKHPPVDA